MTAGASIALVVGAPVALARRVEASPEGAAARSGRDRELDPVLRLLVQAIVAETPTNTLWIAVNAALLLVPAAYLFGLLRSRLARVGLADLLLEMGTMHGAELEAALGRALGDPALRVVHGDVPPASAGRSVARIDRDGQPVAALVYDESLDDDPELVEAVTAAAALALENEQHERGAPTHGWRAEGRRARGSSRRATPNGSGWSGTCTTGPSSASWHCRSS